MSKKTDDSEKELKLSWLCKPMSMVIIKDPAMCMPILCLWKCTSTGSDPRLWKSLKKYHAREDKQYILLLLSIECEHFVREKVCGCSWKRESCLDQLYGSFSIEKASMSSEVAAPMES